MAVYIVLGIFILVFVYFFTRLVFDILLRGFLPFLPSRPWVVDQILSELDLGKEDPTMIALSTGRSGFFHALEKKYPQGTFIGIESDLFPYIVSKIQTLLRMTRIRVIRQPFHRVNVKEADFIYSHLYPDKMRGLGKKLKFECRPDTVVVSTGFIIPDLKIKKMVDLPDRRGRLDWLSKNQSLIQRKSKKFKKEKKAYFFVI